MSTSHDRTKFKILTVVILAIFLLSGFPLLDQAEENDAATSYNMYYNGPTNSISSAGYIIAGDGGVNKLCYTGEVIQTGLDVSDFQWVLTASGQLYKIGGSSANAGVPTLLSSGVSKICNENPLIFLKTNGQLCDNTGAVLASNVKEFVSYINSSTMWYISTDNKLFGKGANGYGQQGSGNTTNVSDFTQRATNVKTAGAEGGVTWYISNSNELFITGRNTDGQQGSGNTTNVTSFTQRGTNVKTAGYHENYGSGSASYYGGMFWYITNDNILYLTGDNHKRQQGVSGADITTFTQRGTDVKDFWCSIASSIHYKTSNSYVQASYAYSAYLTNSGDLYMAGYHAGGSQYSSFTKIASNVKEFHGLLHGVSYSTANNTSGWKTSYSAWYLTNDNQLYGKGTNTFGNMGKGNTNEQTSFAKRADNVKTFGFDSTHTWYITNDNVLFMCGENSYGQQGAPIDVNTALNIVPTFTQRGTNVKEFLEFNGQSAFYLTNSNELYGAGNINFTGSGNSGFQTSFKKLASNVGCTFFKMGGSTGQYFLYTSVQSVTVTISSSNTSYGTVNKSSMSVLHSSSMVVSSNKVTIAGTAVTATPATTTGYTNSFSKWQYSTNNGSSWVDLTGTKTITGNTLVKAVFTQTINTYTVTYKNGSTTVHTESVQYNKTITHTTHSLSGKLFCGWYTDSNFATAFNTSTKITANRTLYGQFVDPLTFTSSPVANATITYASGMGCVLFDALESQSPAKVLWDFGDGTYGDEIVMYHHYDESGTYDVTLSVYNYNGDVDTKSYVVAIYDAEVGPEKDDNTLAIVGGLVAVFVAGFLIARPF